MKKLSTNNFLIRLFYLFMIIIPIVIFFSMKLIFKWELVISMKLFVFFTIAIIIFTLIIKFNIIDWDFYIEDNSLVFKRFCKEQKFISSAKFNIKPIPIATMFFQSYMISFSDGKKFIFKSMPVYKVPYDNSYSKQAKRIKEEVEREFLIEENKT